VCLNQLNITLVYADNDARESGLSGVLGNGVTTWLNAKLYSGQHIVSVQLLPVYEPTGTITFKFEVILLRFFHTALLSETAGTSCTAFTDRTAF